VVSTDLVPHYTCRSACATVLYWMTGFSEAAALLAKPGKHTTGKGCLYIKKLADVDQHVLEALVVRSLASKRARQPS